MRIVDLNDCAEFTAGDNCRLRELLHPDRQPVGLRYSLAHARVAPGQTTWRHRLRTASEVYYILEGQGEMRIGDETAPVRAGQAVYIPPDAEQCITNTGDADLVFLCIVDPAWRADDEQVG